MEPEGCTASELEQTRRAHRLHVDTIKEILRTLWTFRLLGYLPADTLDKTYDEVAKAVAAGLRSPSA